MKRLKNKLVNFVISMIEVNFLICKNVINLNVLTYTAIKIEIDVKEWVQFFKEVFYFNIDIIT